MPAADNSDGVRPSRPHVGLISLEPWDQVWRRNQHLVAELLDQHLVQRLTFVEPPVPALRSRRRSPLPGVVVVTPPLMIPRRYGGLWLTGLLLRFTALRGADPLWVNDPTLGVHCAGRTTPTIYDVTDDWRHTEKPPRLLRRLVKAEDQLTKRARVVVCSPVLARRWAERYGVTTPVVQNAAPPRAENVHASGPLSGDAPHIGYVGTLQQERLDIDLVVALARSKEVGTMHLIGPDHMSETAKTQLAGEPKIRLEPPVEHDSVPALLASLDVLVAPHLVTAFTLSLDAIKSFEYLASGRPVVATPTSGFQDLSAEGLWVTDADMFTEAVAAALAANASYVRSVATWADRAREFVAAWPAVTR